jgi:hypothetical protein
MTVHDHLIDGHGKGVLMPVQRHAQTVANADNINARAFRPTGRRNLAHGDHDQPYASCLLRGQLRQCQFFTRLGHPALFPEWNRRFFVPFGTVCAKAVHSGNDNPAKEERAKAWTDQTRQT